MKKAYAEKRFFEWHEDELAVSLRAKSGSYGGQRNAYTGIKPEPRKSRGYRSLPLSPRKHGIRGGYVPMIVDTLVFDESSITSPVNGNQPTWGGVCHTLSKEAGRCVVIIKSYGFDSYNQATEEEMAQPLRSHGGGDTMPKVIVFRDDITIKVDGGRCLCPRYNAQGASDNDLSANSRND